MGCSLQKKPLSTISAPPTRLACRVELTGSHRVPLQPRRFALPFRQEDRGGRHHQSCPFMNKQNNTPLKIHILPLRLLRAKTSNGPKAPPVTPHPPGPSQSIILYQEQHPATNKQLLVPPTWLNKNTGKITSASSGYFHQITASL